MARLIRYNPFNELETLHSAMDRLFEDTFTRTPMQWTRSWTIPLDVVEQDEAFVIKATVPGIDPDDLEITIDNNVLSIKGEVQAEREVEGERYHLRERGYGEFSRSFSLPATVNPDQIEASYKDGILTLELPKSEAAKPKRIPIKAGESKVIEG